MGILRSDRVSGLGGANAIKGSVFFGTNDSNTADTNLAITNTSDLDIGAGNYTIEYWFNCDDTETGSFDTSVALSEYTNLSANNAFNIYHQSKGFNVYNRTGGGFTQLANPTDKWIPSRWHHFAWVRSGTGTNENAIYVDGVSVVTFTNALNYTSGQHWLIGGNFYSGSEGYGNNPQYGFSGHLSNVRVSNVARYSGAFTPPTAEFSVDSNTILLACQSPSNILQEATGKEVTYYGGSLNSAPPQASRFTPNSPIGFSTTTDVGSQYGTTFEDNTKFDILSYMVPPGGNTRERGRGRGLAGGGWSPSIHNQIYSVEIASDGSSADFGDLTMARRGTGAVASHTRGIWAGGYAPQYQDRIDFVTIASTGNAIDFGNLDTGRFESSGVSNDTRGVFGPSEYHSASQNVIQYVTMATAGNATDFGDSTVATKKQASMNSTTRGIFAGGQDVPSPTAYLNFIDYITTATTGNATDFGDLTQNVFMTTGVCDSTRGVRGGGAKSPSPANTNVMDYVTIASTGNATDYGDLTTANQRSAGMSNSNRGLFSGGATPNSSTSVNSIDKITIQTIGNAVDFGDYIGTAVTQAAGCSDSHGGLS